MMPFALSRINWGMVGVVAVALVTRLLIVDWTLPYAGNPAHEHPFFYDSGLVIHDQYTVLRGLANLPSGPFREAADAAWPVVQRYIAAVPLMLWFARDYGFDQAVVMAAPYVETAYKTLLVNRLVSVAASLLSIGLLWVLLRRHLPSMLSLFLTAVFSLTVSEIGLSIHEKTVSLVTVMYLIEALLLDRWARTRGYEFKYLWWAVFFVGLATAAREYGLLFGGLLAALIVIFVLGRRVYKLLATHYSLLLVVALLAGIAVGSPDIFVELPYWAAAVLEPGGRAWHTTSLSTIPLEMWALGKLLFGGSIGTVFAMASLVYVGLNFKKHLPFVRAVAVWSILYLIIFIFYPLKDPRFIAGLTPFVFLLIGLFVHYWYLVRDEQPDWWSMFNRSLPYIVLALWFAVTLGWATSAWVFFNGYDMRLRAADEFNATFPTGVSVGEFFPSYHTLHVPVDDVKFQHYQYDDLHSLFPELLFIDSRREGQASKDVRGELIGDPSIWPQFVVIDYETDAYTYPSDQVSKHKFRDSILASGRYELVATYPKRRGPLANFGLFSTKSRWVYLNPVVEIYRLRP